MPPQIKISHPTALEDVKAKKTMMDIITEVLNFWDIQYYINKIIYCIYLRRLSKKTGWEKYRINEG